jgi:hypothetical protein
VETKRKNRRETKTSSNFEIVVREVQMLSLLFPRCCSVFVKRMIAVTTIFEWNLEKTVEADFKRHPREEKK